MVQMGVLRPKIGNAFHMARKSLQLIGERSAIKVIDLRVHPHDPFTNNACPSGVEAGAYRDSIATMY